MVRPEIIITPVSLRLKNSRRPETAIQGTAGAAKPRREAKNKHADPATASLQERIAFCCCTDESVPGGAITVGKDMRATFAITATAAMKAKANVTPKPAPKL